MGYIIIYLTSILRPSSRYDSQIHLWQVDSSLWLETSRVFLACLWENPCDVQKTAWTVYIDIQKQWVAWTWDWLQLTVGLTYTWPQTLC